MKNPPSLPYAEDAAVLNLKGLVINSFSLQLLNEPVKQNESSLPALCDSPQTSCVRLRVRLPEAMAHAVLPQRAAALGDKETKQTSSYPLPMCFKKPRFPMSYIPAISGRSVYRQTWPLLSTRSPLLAWLIKGACSPFASMW